MANIAVIDFETTGLWPYQHDRVIEIGVVVISPQGEVLQERMSLVNPNRDVGPTAIHGITATHLVTAPTFADAIGHFSDLFMSAGTVAAHNARFDMEFLSAEFRRMGLPAPSIPVLCTMRMSGGGSLDECCARFGVEIEGPRHSALADARGAARLLAAILRAQPGLANELHARPACSWPSLLVGAPCLVSRREAAARLEAAPGYLDALYGWTPQFASRPADPTGVLEYADALGRALRDRFIHDEEGKQLVELALRWALPSEALKAVHEYTFRRLIAVAKQDHVISSTERTDLLEVAKLLGIDRADAERALPESKVSVPKAGRDSGRQWSGRGEQSVQVSAALRVTTQIGTLIDSEYTGATICFTGESQCCVAGQPITRELARELASQRGITVMENFTKKVGFLVVADPNSQSGKAKKARDAGVPIVHEKAFWSAIGVPTD